LGWTAIGSEIRLGDPIGQISNNAAECSRMTKRQNSLDRSEMTILPKIRFTTADFRGTAIDSDFQCNSIDSEAEKLTVRPFIASNGFVNLFEK
jgi:hypothetical protein